MTKLGLVVVVLTCACAKKDGASGGSCKPLTVTVDGAPLPALTKGLAKANNMNGDISYEVQLFNHDKATCDELLDKTGRQHPGGEISVRVLTSHQMCSGSSSVSDSGGGALSARVGSTA